ncbi:two-partner secretion domain-containing protein, partial [Caldimonas manganoxidans]|uniref:two-partner secretion domain-containing protein n=1 Tax=Caldimonas manganoxidans TaxID=196015 RepID=UPI0003780C7A
MHGLNHVYRLIWSDIHQAFIAVCEYARARGMRSGAVIAVAALLSAPAFAADLPTGGQIVAGSGSITQSGTVMTVTQDTAKMAANWQSFSIGQGHTVNFVQPSASAVALNRVLGSDVSVIQGALNANGQVFLINPNGVLFTPTAQVNVGGIVTSTLNLSNEDFLAGRYRFSGDSAASVINQGNIQTAPGGTAAFIAAKIENTGTITAPQGNVLMGAGKTVTLDLGGPVKIQVEEGALDTLIEQGGAIKADGGLVYLAAKAAESLTRSVINHTGITEAKSLSVDDKGEIYLMGDMAQGEVRVAGTLDASPTAAAAASGAQGGFIETSAARVKVADGAQVKAGHWLIDPNDFTIAASGGDITGSAVSTALASGNVTIQTTSTTPACTGLTGCGSGTSGNGDIFVRDNITWSSGNTLTLSAYRNIEVLATIDASSGAGGKVAFQYGQGSPSGVIGGTAATYSFGLTGSGFTGRINLQAGNNFTTKLGWFGTPITWTVITSLGSAGSTTGSDLQGMQGNLTGNFALGADINASATSAWNSGAGFQPIGNSTNNFTGRFDGLGHTVQTLRISRIATSSYNVGLFGVTASAARIANVGLATPSVSGIGSVGTLVGTNGGTIVQSYAMNPSTTSAMALAQTEVGGLVGTNSGTIKQSFSTGKVSAAYLTSSTAGGLVGKNSGTITESYATGATSSSGDAVGGLVGWQSGGTISDSYASGNADGNNKVGGLVGEQTGGSISQSYAAGTVSGNGSLGGLIGNKTGGTITASFYATTDTNGNSINNGGASGLTWSGNGNGTAKTSAELKQLATYPAVWNIDDAGGTGKVWRIYDGNSYPLLRAFLTPLTVTANSGSRTYDGTINALGVSYSTTPDSTLLGTASVNGVTSKDVGTYTLTASGLYSTSQSGYDISYAPGTLTITPRPVTVTADAKSKTQGQSDPALTYTTGCGTASSPCGLVAGDTLAGSLSRVPGEAVGSYAIQQGTVDDAHNPNYAIAYVGADLTILTAAGGGFSG